MFYLPLSCHPAAVRVSADFTQRCAAGVTGDRQRWSGGAQPVVHSGEIGDVGRGREVSERLMRLRGVVVGDPGGDLGASVVEFKELRLIEFSSRMRPLKLMMGSPGSLRAED